MRRTCHVEEGDRFVARADGDARDAPRYGGEGGAHGAAQAHDEGAEIGAVVGACDEEVGRLVPRRVVAGQDVVQRDKGARCRLYVLLAWMSGLCVRSSYGAVVVPDVLVRWIATYSRGSSRNDVVL